MNINQGGGLIGLSLLTGTATNAFAAPIKVESRAVRLAKAQFTLPASTPPWQQPSTRVSASVAAIRGMKSIIDPPQLPANLAPELRLPFTTYKALDRLRVLAEAAVRPAASPSERASLHAVFETGLADLQRFLGGASGGALALSFAEPRRKTESLAVPSVAATEVTGTGVTKDRLAAISGLIGSERLALRLERPGGSATLSVDLAQSAQPPTLDSVAGALNAAIAGIPKLGADGAPVIGADGQPRRAWDTSFSVVKGASGWALQLNTMGVEQVSLVEEGVASGLMVSTSQSVGGAPATVSLSRFDFAGPAMERTALRALDATDRAATEAARLLSGKLTTNAPVAAPIEARATISDPDGFTYVLANSSGDVGSHRGDGLTDLRLSKIDSRGAVVWQRTLGTAGSSEGAALSLAPDGDILLAGTAHGGFDGASSDGDLFVARFSSTGDERFATLIRAPGADVASAVTATPSGDVVVGGRAAGNGGDAFLARVSAGGDLLQRRVIDGGGRETLHALAVGADGSILALTSEDESSQLRRIDPSDLSRDLGVQDLAGIAGRTLAVSDTGQVAVGGTSEDDAADSRVWIADAELSGGRSVAIASGGNDQVDSLAWQGDDLFAGGRTSGNLSGMRSGTVDAFVARIDGANASVVSVTQWGRSGAKVGPVALSVAASGDSAVQALGFRSGILNPASSARLTTQTSLRVGDSFAFRVDGGALQSIAIRADDTMASLAERIAKAGGKAISAATAKTDTGLTLRLEARPGHSLELRAGPESTDALRKLGFESARLVAPAAADPKAPRVTPGGHYGLELSAALNLRDEASAKAALGKLRNAISTTQSAYRSLYWDENKESLANGGRASGAVSPYLASQLGRYREALSRLGGGS